MRALLERPDVPVEVREALWSRLAEAEAEGERLRSEVGQLRFTVAELRAERDDTSRVIDASPALVCRVAIDGTTLAVNSACERATGYAASELVGHNWWAALCPGNGYAQAQQLLAAVEAGPVTDYEMVLTTRSGERRSISWTWTSRLDSEGRLLETVGFGIDATERRRREEEARRLGEALAQSEQRYRVIERQTRDNIWTIDLEGRYTRVSPAIERLLGYTAEDLTGRPFAETMAPGSCARAQQAMAEAVAAARSGHAAEFSHTGEYEVIARGGRGVWVEIQAGIVLDADGEPAGFAGVTRDITERKEGEQALQAERARLAAILRAAPAGIALVDGRTVVEMNDCLAEMTGHSTEELRGRTTRCLYADGDEYRRVGEVLYGGPGERGLRAVETQFVCADGARIDVLMRACPLDPSQPEGLAIVAVLDITERKRAEEALLANEARLAAILKAAPVGISLIQGGRFLEINDYSVGLNGRPWEEMIGRSPRLLYTSDEVYERDRAALYAGIAERGVGVVETQFVRPDGRTCDILLHACPLSPADRGGPVLFVALDITERTRAEEALRADEARLAAILRAAPAAITMLQGRTIVEMSDYLTEMTGWTRNDLLGNTSRRLYATDQEYERVGRALYSGARDQGLGAVETQFVRTDGRIVDVLLRACPLDASDPEGPFVVTALDVTEPRRAEEALRASEAQMSAILRGAPAGIAMLRGREVFLANDYFSKITGYSLPELVGRRSRHLYASDEEYERVGAAIYGPIRDSGSGSAETRFVRKDGQFVDVVLRASPLDPADRDGLVLVTALDITERKRAEEELRLSSQRMKLHVDRTPLGVIEWDTDFRVTEWNPAAEAIFGYSRAEAIGQRGTFIVPESAQAKVEGVWQAITSGSGHERSTNKNLRRDGTLLTCEWYNTPLVNDAGDATGAASLVLDITERTTAEEERRRLEANAQRLQRLEGIGVLAGGIAHDFNNLLSAILGFGELAVMDSPEGSRERQRLEQIVAAGERARDLVRQILTFSRMHESHPVAASLAPVIKESLKFLRASLPSTIEFRTSLDAACGKVLVDPTQFHQVIMNLCTNAGQAMAEGGGVLEVQLAEVEVDPALAERVSVAQLGRYARLTVSDTGAGMDAETLDRIFEPFFTTRPTGEGTGLGLSTVHGVVRSHSGGITVYSEPGVGTTFHVYLPIAPAAGESPVREGTDLPVGTERIMVVDDEPAVAAVATEALRALGYQVEEFTDSRRALKAFREDPGRCDLVLTDQTMPHFTGTQLLASMQFMRPELPVIIATGFHPRVQLSSLVAGPPPTVMIKPYTIAELAQRVRDALDEAGARQSGAEDG